MTKSIEDHLLEQVVLLRRTLELEHADWKIWRRAVGLTPSENGKSTAYPSSQETVEVMHRNPLRRGFVLTNDGTSGPDCLVRFGTQPPRSDEFSLRLASGQRFSSWQELPFFLGPVWVLWTATSATARLMVTEFD